MLAVSSVETAGLTIGRESISTKRYYIIIAFLHVILYGLSKSVSCGLKNKVLCNC